MKTKLLFFGRIAEHLGPECMIDIPEGGCTVAELRRQFWDEQPATRDLMTQGKIFVAIDQEIARDEDEVRPGQEVAFFSPLSGG